jgi:RNA polymerase sigma-B factor
MGFMTAGFGQLTDADLARLVQSRSVGDPERQAACEILVERHAAIVRSCAYRYRAVPELSEDLVQVGYLGLMRAISNFDPQVGENLAAYAQACVSGEIKRHFRDRRWQLRVGRPAQELRLRIRAATGDLTQQLSRPPGDGELAAHLGVSEAEIADARLASQAFQVASLDAPAGAGDGTAVLGDLLGTEDPQLEHALDIESVWKHAAELPPREQRLLMMRFYGNMTQGQIGAELGISQMHVSRLLRHALAYLREKLTGQAEPATG